jgi:hypothetical protein
MILCSIIVAFTDNHITKKDFIKIITDFETVMRTTVIGIYSEIYTMTPKTISWVVNVEAIPIVDLGWLQTWPMPKPIVLFIWLIKQTLLILWPESKVLNDIDFLNLCIARWRLCHKLITDALPVFRILFKFIGLYLLPLWLLLQRISPLWRVLTAQKLKDLS